MSALIMQEIARLKSLTVGQLRMEWERLYGEPTRSRNRDYLWRRLSWRIQEIACGGLTAESKARILDLAPATFVRSQVPPGFLPAAGERPTSPGIFRGDPRLPKPGSTLLRRYKGNDVRVTVLDDGFEYDGAHFETLSEIAYAVTGSHWSGPLFFGLRSRSR